MTEQTRIFAVRLILDSREAVFDCHADEIVMDAARCNGVYMASYCKQGGCGACTSRLISGQVDYVRNIKGAPQNPVVGDLVRPCSCNALSDLVLEPQSPWKQSSE